MASSDARAAILDVMTRYPDLTIDGLGGDRRPNFAERRAELLDAVIEFERARAWLALVPKRRMPNRKSGHSYFLKHVIEICTGAYVSNGATITAAAHLGFPIGQCPSRINCWIAVAGRRKWPADAITKGQVSPG